MEYQVKVLTAPRFPDGGQSVVDEESVNPVLSLLFFKSTNSPSLWTRRLATEGQWGSNEPLTAI